MCGCRGRQLALDVAEGLAFLHTHMNCLHADLKARWGGQSARSVVGLPGCRAALGRDMSVGRVPLFPRVC